MNALKTSMTELGSMSLYKVQFYPVGFSKELVTDADGNTYKSVKIGKQIWMSENLRTTKYNDGAPIPFLQKSHEWTNCNTPAFCYYRNTGNQDAQKKYGALYNWYVVNTKKLAPFGWHVPTVEEWNKLEMYLIANRYNWDNWTTGNKIAKALAASADWRRYEKIGAIGSVVQLNNRTGFSAFPSGFRSNHGGFATIGTCTGFWTASESLGVNAYYRELGYDCASFDTCIVSMKCGFSVRLVKD